MKFKLKPLATVAILGAMSLGVAGCSEPSNEKPVSVEKTPVQLEKPAVTTVDSQKLSVEKVKSLFPEARVVSHKKVGADLYEVQLQPNEMFFKRTAIYTNSAADYVSSQMNFVADNKLQSANPDFGYDAIDLMKHATFITGSGSPRFVFVKPLSSAGINGLKEVLEDTEHTNYVYISFDKTSDSQTYLMMPLFHGDNENKVNTAKTTVSMIKSMAYGNITEKEAQAQVAKKIAVIKSAENTDAVDQLVDSLRKSLELSDIFADGKDFIVFDKNRADITPEPAQIAEHNQTIKSFDFSVYGESVNNRLMQYVRATQQGKKISQYDFSDIDPSEFKTVIEEATAYKIGNGPKEYLLFTDIDCPYCVRLENVLDEHVNPDVTVRVMFFPIQGLHPNALDKHRHLLSLPESARAAKAKQIRGAQKTGLESKEAIGGLTNDQLKPIDAVISQSYLLGQIFNVMGTPTVMSIENGVIKNARQDQVIDTKKLKLN